MINPTKNCIFIHIYMATFVEQHQRTAFAAKKEIRAGEPLFQATYFFVTMTSWFETYGSVSSYAAWRSGVMETAEMIMSY